MIFAFDLRPARYQIDKYNNITIASETGVNPIDNDRIVSKGRITPGGLLAINTENAKVFSEKEIDDVLKNKAPYRKWLKENAIYVESVLISMKVLDLKKSVQRNLRYLQSFFYFTKKKELLS